MPSRYRTPRPRIHRASGLVVITLGGRDFYTGRAGQDASQAEAYELLHLWLSQGRPRGGPTHVGNGGSATAAVVRRPVSEPSAGRAANRKVVAELVNGYLQYAAEYYRPPSRERQAIQYALAYLDDVLDTPAERYGPLALKQTRQRMIAAGLCRNLINRYVRYVVRMFRWAGEQEWIGGEVYAALRSVEPLKRNRSEARETAPVGPVQDADVDAILPYLPNILKTMVRIQQLTGMRTGELVQMRPCDIDRTKSVWHFRPRHHKTLHHGHTRAVALGPNCKALLAPYLAAEANPEAHLFSPAKAVAERNTLKRQRRQTPVQPSHLNRARKKPRRTPGDRYDTRSYWRALHYAQLRAARAGVTFNRWHPHQLRHALATKVRRDHGLDAARAVLGQHSLAIAATYAQLDAGLAASIAETTG